MANNRSKTMKEQNRKDRRDESRGMERYERSRERGYGRIAGESGMIKEDHSAMANLPQEPVMRKYPSWDYLNGTYLDDSIRGIDDLNRDNVRRTSRSSRRDAY